MSKLGAPFMQRVKTVCPTGPIRCRRCADGVPKTTTSHAHWHLGLTCPNFFGQTVENGIVFCRRESKEAPELRVHPLVVGSCVRRHLLGRHCP